MDPITLLIIIFLPSILKFFQRVLMYFGYQIERYDIDLNWKTVGGAIAISAGLGFLIAIAADSSWFYSSLFVFLGFAIFYFIIDIEEHGVFCLKWGCFLSIFACLVLVAFAYAYELNPIRILNLQDSIWSFAGWDTSGIEEEKQEVRATQTVEALPTPDWWKVSIFSAPEDSCILTSTRSLVLYSELDLMNPLNNYPSNTDFIYIGRSLNRRIYCVSDGKGTVGWTNNDSFDDRALSKCGKDARDFSFLDEPYTKINCPYD